MGLKVDGGVTVDVGGKCFGHTEVERRDDMNEIHVSRRQPFDRRLRVTAAAAAAACTVPFSPP
jgi:hypothetical protein